MTANTPDPHPHPARPGIPDPTPATTPGVTAVADPPPRLSLIIPTRNEAGNVAELLTQVRTALHGLTAEVIVVDDSTDETPELLRAAAGTYPVPLRVHHRDVGVGGLGGAVVEGVRLARGDWVVVMDADLQHPPAVVPTLVRTGERLDADLVVASRYARGGSLGGLAGPGRLLVSGGATLLAKGAFPRALRGVTDPMSGFFAIRRSTIDVDGLRPLGYKILLELVVRCRPRAVAEVPYPFGDRHAGASKSSLREGLRYVRHLSRLRFGDVPTEMLLFGLIGLSGFVPNALVTWALTELVGLPYVVSAILATQVAILWNFVLVDQLLFRNRRRRGLAGRLGVFTLVSNVDLIIRIPLLAGLVELAGVGYLVGTLITLTAMFVLRFTLTHRIVYQATPAEGPQRVLRGWLRPTVFDPPSPGPTGLGEVAQSLVPDPALEVR